MKLNEVRYIYFGRSERKNNRVITVASKLTLDADQQIVIQFGAAFCNKRDSFVKSEGRALAWERMEDPAWSNIIPFKGNTVNQITDWLDANRDILPYNYQNISLYWGVERIEG